MTQASPRAQEPAAPAGRAELESRDFGPFSRAFSRRFFDPIPFPSEGEELLARLCREGEVVHVMRSSGIINFLFLAWSLVRRALPPLRAAIGLGWFLWKPIRRLHRRGPAPLRLSRALDGGGSALVFLARRRGWLPLLSPEDDPFFALIARARASPRPLFLVPELFLWHRRARSVKPRLVDLVFGSPEQPGMIRTAIAFMLHYRHAFVRVGRPINLTEFVTANAGDADAVLARKVRGALLQHLARETRAIVGPPRKHPDRIIEEVLRDRTLRQALDDAVAETGLKRPAARRARRYLNEIAARYDPSLVAMAKPVMAWVFNRIYDGIEVDEPGLSRALAVAREAPVVFCPSHKSHIDYLVLNWVLADRGVTPPHIAAGTNLSFWPLGALLRRLGAFFLRRSFKGKRIYAAAFRAYVKKLLKEGYAQEFFIEGGRSRTGKLLSPKLGMVAFEVDAFLEGAQEDVHFVPLAIDYEKVVEAREYASELAGGEKRPESLKSLLAAPRILSARYGRIYLSFDEPISLRRFLLARALDPAAVAEEPRRAAVRALAQRILFGISRATTLTPAALVAAALLGHRRRGISARDAGARIHLLREIARREGARLSRVLEGAPSDPSTLGPINEVLRLFLDDGSVSSQVAGGETIYAVLDEKRSALAFYKNNLVHLVASRAVVASAILCGGPGSPKEVSERALDLSRLLKLELPFRVGVAFDAVFAQTVSELVEGGLATATPQAVLPAPEPHARHGLSFLKNLIRDFVESYRAFACALEKVHGPVERKELVKLALECARADFLAGSRASAESISRTTMENALELFVERGFLAEVGDDGRSVAPGPAFVGGAGLAQLMESMDRFLAPDPA